MSLCYSATALRYNATILYYSVKAFCHSAKVICEIVIILCYNIKPLYVIGLKHFVIMLIYVIMLNYDSDKLYDSNKVIGICDSIIFMVKQICTRVSALCDGSHNSAKTIHDNT